MTGNCRPLPEQLFAPAEGAMEATSIGTEEDLESQGLVSRSQTMGAGS